MILPFALPLVYPYSLAKIFQASHIANSSILPLRTLTGGSVPPELRTRSYHNAFQNENLKFLKFFSKEMTEFFFFRVECQQIFSMLVTMSTGYSNWFHEIVNDSAQFTFVSLAVWYQCRMCDWNFDTIASITNLWRIIIINRRNSCWLFAGPVSASL